MTKRYPGGTLCYFNNVADEHIRLMEFRGVLLTRTGNHITNECGELRPVFAMTPLGEEIFEWARARRMRQLLEEAADDAA